MAQQPERLGHRFRLPIPESSGLRVHRHRSNTTVCWSPNPTAGGSAKVLRQPHSTRIGKGLASEDAIPPAQDREVVEVVGTQVRVARGARSETIRLVATAAIRDAVNQEELTGAIAARTGIDVDVLTDEEEARLRSSERPALSTTRRTGDIAVVDVGGASSEIAIGTTAGGVRASSSFRVGSGTLTDSYCARIRPRSTSSRRSAHTSPARSRLCPSGDEARRRAVGGQRDIAAPARRNLLDHESLERGLRMLARTPSEELARTAEIEVERARLLPAGC